MLYYNTSICINSFISDIILVNYNKNNYKLISGDDNYVILKIVLHYLDLNHVQNLLVLAVPVRVQVIRGM